MSSRINYPIFSLICLLFFFLETTIFSEIVIVNYFSFFAIAIIAAGIVSCSVNFFYSVFVLGLFLDIYSTSSFGIHMTSFVLLIFFVCVLKGRILKKDTFARTILVIFLSILFYNLIQIIIIYPYILEDYFEYNFFVKKIISDIIGGVFLSIVLIHLIKRKRDESVLYKKEK